VRFEYYHQQSVIIKTFAAPSAWAIKSKKASMGKSVMSSIFKRFYSDENGSTAIEYALIGTLISVFIIASVKSMTGELHNVWGTVETAVSTATTKSPSTTSGK
jgi:pilus assembly protein Flp/PilA